MSEPAGGPYQRSTAREALVHEPENKNPARVLVTGSRDWDDPRAVAHMLDQAHWVWQHVVVVHGGCPTGADAMAEAWATSRGVPTEVHPADWAKHGRRAGYLRNVEMVAAGAVACLAFIRDRSKGASMTARLAERANIPVLTVRAASGGHEPSAERQERDRG